MLLNPRDFSDTGERPSPNDIIITEISIREAILRGEEGKTVTDTNPPGSLVPPESYTEKRLSLRL
jgi:hypothetical protein